MHPFDYLILFLYLVSTLIIGCLFSKEQKGNYDFFLAGRSMRWFPIGLSIMATAFSAVNYTAFSGEIFGQGMYVLLCIPVFLIVAIPVLRIIIPFFYPMGLCSVYEYLERRFDFRVRIIAGFLFLLWRIFWMAAMLYVPCKVLGVITGMNVSFLILLTGIVATTYSISGGIKAVMWTDVMQFFVLLTGILLSVVLASARTPGGLMGIINLGISKGLMRPFYPLDPRVFSFSPYIRITLWSCWIGTFVAFLTRYGTDQVVVQRYFTARTQRDARMGFHLSYISAIFSLLLLTLMGLAIYAHCFNTGILGDKGLQPIFYFSLFVKSLPRGMTGLIIAGLIAATMSSIDSGMNSCSTVFFTDFYEPFFPEKRHEGVRIGRMLTLLFGGFATVMALYIGRMGSIFEIANRVVNGIGSPLLAIFILGMFSRKANSHGMIIGGILGAAWSAYVSFGIECLALHYYAVVNLLGTLFLCYLFSLIENMLLGPPTEQQVSWTWQKRRPGTCFYPIQ